MFEGESSPEVRVFMTEEEVLWHEFEHGFSQQGSSSEGNHAYGNTKCEGAL